MHGNLPAETYAQLARFDTATICNVIEVFNHRPRTSGTLNASVESIYPQHPPMIGHAVTATFRSAHPASPHETCLNLFDQQAAFETVPTPRVMVIQDLDDPRGGAVYGEVMVNLCKAFGCVGLVTNGYARDILQVQPLGFPCFAAGVCATHANCRILAINQPVDIAGVTIAPGDLLHGDANGVTRVPIAIAQQVAEICQPYVDAEQVLLDSLIDGSATKDRGQAAQTEFRRRLDEIHRRLGKGGDKASGMV